MPCVPRAFQRLQFKVAGPAGLLGGLEWDSLNEIDPSTLIRNADWKTMIFENYFKIQTKKKKNVGKRTEQIASNS